ncbi:MAG: hypothetical protein JSR75_08965 [Proteobacteria bacterium]|nr:hypothetical protein [Pseudomonadota bacterium]
MSSPLGEGRALEQVLYVLRPLVRLLIQRGVGYGALAAALKRVFLDEARRELQRQGRPETDSALSLLSGLHRHNVRSVAGAAERGGRPPSVAVDVVGRWLGERRWRDRQGRPRLLPRGPQGTAAVPARAAPSFDELVHSVSRDVRPRAVLDELVRLGIAEERDEGVRLLADGFVPRGDPEVMGEILAANLHDHAAAAVANLVGEGRFFERAVVMDQLSEASGAALHALCRSEMKRVLQKLHTAAQSRAAADAGLPAPRGRRARFGVFFYAEER